MREFQIQYKNESGTFNDTFYSLDEQSIINAFQKLVNAEITEIREVVYKNPVYKKDDGDYVKYASCFFTGVNNQFSSFKIPKLKKTISDNDLIPILKQYVKLNALIPKTVKITRKY